MRKTCFQKLLSDIQLAPLRLGLNCLSMAYVMSVQYLDGVKFGDAQMTASGLATAGMFLSLSRAMPLERLAPKRQGRGAFTCLHSSSLTLS